MNSIFTMRKTRYSYHLGLIVLMGTQLTSQSNLVRIAEGGDIVCVCVFMVKLAKEMCVCVCICVLYIVSEFGLVRLRCPVSGASVNGLHATSFFELQIESECDNGGAGLVSLRRNIELLVDEHCGKYDSFGTDGITAYSCAIFDFKSTISFSFCRMTSKPNKEYVNYGMQRDEPEI